MTALDAPTDNLASLINQLDLEGHPIPTYSAIRVSEQDPTGVVLPPLPIDYSPSDLVFILHTSGSSGKSPKLVPCNRRWLDNIITKSNELFKLKAKMSPQLCKEFIRIVSG